MKTIFLKDHIETVKIECLNRNSLDHYFSPELIDQAIQAQVNDNLRYKNGKTYCNEFGVGSEYVNKSDIPNYETEAECAKWEFSGYVRNSASRLKRGFTAI